MKVLMIDDDEDTNFLIEMLLLKNPKIEECRTHCNPSLALQELREKKIQPDCIFVDLTMPGMDGYEFVNAYQEYFSTHTQKAIIYILSRAC